MRHRVLFYSHDSYGLGHFRRSLTIASFLTRHIDGLSVLMLTSLDLPASFESPPGVDFVKLPSIWKAGPDQYRSRHLRVSFNRVRRMRRNLIRGVVKAFDPTLMVVDNVPRGVDGELLPTLRLLRQQRPHTRIALTLRDVLDTPANILPKWRQQGVYEVLEEFYDEVWVAGCQAVFDPMELYEFPAAIRERVKFCGYVTRSSVAGDVEALRRELRLGEQPLVVASCGGGGDGYELLSAFTNAFEPLARRGVRSAVFLGPDMPAMQRRDLKQRLLAQPGNPFVFDFRPDLVTFLRLASASVSMAGYNTVCELISQRAPALTVPRVYPRREQILRAEALASRGLLQVVPPAELSPERLRHDMEELIATAGQWPQRANWDAVDFSGLSRITRRVRKLLGVGDDA
jgi:predicted glycosyltransferase